MNKDRIIVTSNSQKKVLEWFINQPRRYYCVSDISIDLESGNISHCLFSLKKKNIFVTKEKIRREYFVSDLGKKFLRRVNKTHYKINKEGLNICYI